MAMDFFFSRMLAKPIVDAGGRKVGKVRDLVVLWDGATPRVTGVKFRRDRQGLFPSEAVGSIGDDGLKLLVDFDASLTKPLLDDELYVGRWLLDKQIIDLQGSRLVRVNDITVSWSIDDGGRTFELGAVDIGIRGLFRRLGLEFLVSGWKNQFIGLQYIKPLEDRTSDLQLNRDKGRLRRIHPADIAELAEQMDYRSRVSFLGSLDCDQAGEAIGEMELDTQVGVIEQMDAGRASDILEEMPPDEVADILGGVAPEKKREILSLLPVEEAREVCELMEYPEDTAGGLMTTGFLRLPVHLTADQAVRAIRELATEAETIYYVYILDADGRLTGVMSLRELIVATPDIPLKAAMKENLITVRHNASQHDVAGIIAKYGLTAVPVVDDGGVMLGIVTVDDILPLLMPERGGFDAGLLFRGSKTAARKW